MKQDRQYTRHDTLLEVRFLSAAEFVSEYAENLSSGGLFIRHAQALEPLSEIDVQIDLPGFASYHVKAKVAHVMTEEMAKRFKRHPGAGLQLTETPAGFQEALAGYLARLGRRRDGLVLVEDSECQSMLGSAGFQTDSADIARVTERVMVAKILAIVALKPSAQKFRDAIAIAPHKVPVVGCDCLHDQEPLLIELDRLLESAPA